MIAFILSISNILFQAALTATWFYFFGTSKELDVILASQAPWLIFVAIANGFQPITVTHLKKSVTLKKSIHLWIAISFFIGSFFLIYNFLFDILSWLPWAFLYFSQSLLIGISLSNKSLNESIFFQVFTNFLALLLTLLFARVDNLSTYTTNIAFGFLISNSLYIYKLIRLDLNFKFLFEYTMLLYKNLEYLVLSMAVRSPEAVERIVLLSLAPGALSTVYYFRSIINVGNKVIKDTAGNYDLVRDLGALKINQLKSFFYFFVVNCGIFSAVFLLFMLALDVGNTLFPINPSIASLKDVKFEIYIMFIILGSLMSLGTFVSNIFYRSMNSRVLARIDVIASLLYFTMLILIYKLRIVSLINIITIFILYYLIGNFISIFILRIKSKEKLYG